MTDRPSIDAFSTAKDNAFALTEAHTPELASQYATVIRRAGRRAARRFKTSARLVSLQADGLVREEDGLELVAASETPKWAVPPVDDLLDVVQVTQDLLGATQKTRESAATSAVRPITSTMGVSFELEAPLVKDLVAKAGVRAAKISIPGLRDAVYLAIRQAFEEGLSVDQTAALIYEKADNLAGYQAEMLARTDLIGTANGGSLLAAKTVWPQGGITKRWVNATDSNTINDGRIRPTHMEANGQEVPIDGHFIVGGARMLYPGDPAGPDDEVCNCRCTLVYHDALQAAAQPNLSDKAMVAVYPRAYEQEALALQDGADPETLHVTVFYLGDVSGVDTDAVAAALEELAGAHAPLEGKVSGVGRFEAGDDGVPVFAIPSVQGLSEIHAAVSDALEQQGITNPSEHGFNPHITLTYADEDGLELPDVPDVPLHFDAITLAQGNVRRDFPFAGVVQAAAWDEAKHPRYEAGRREGGRFAPKQPADAPPVDDKGLLAWIRDDVEGLRSIVERDTPDELEQDRIIDGYEQQMIDRYHEEYDAGARTIAERLKGMPATITPYPPSDAMALSDPNRHPGGSFMVGLADDPATAFTVFTDTDGSLSEWQDGVGDVLDPTDPDFFPADDTTGKVRGDKITGDSTLYRGMSAAERSAWDAGEPIPVGKFFTSEPTANMAQDIAGEFPELHEFTVANNDVVETDPGVFQLIRPATLRDGKIAAEHGDVQAAAWDESKHPRESAGRREGGRFARAAGPVMGVKRLGVTSVNGVFVGDLDGEKVIVKPQAGLTPDRLRDYVDPGRDLEREQAASIVANMLEEDAPTVAIPVPENRIMEAAGYGRSGVSEFINGETVAVLGNTQPARVGKGIAPAIRNVRLYDGIIGNTDRHDGNMVLDHAGTLHAIDHGLAFPSRNQTKWPAIQGAYMETELSPDERVALERVRPRIQSSPELAALLTPDELAATDARIGFMLDRNRLVTADDWQAGFGNALEEAAA